MASKKKSRSVTSREISGKSKTKDEAAKDNKVKELPLKDEIGRKVGRFDKSKGGEKSAVKKSEAGHRIEITKGKTNDKKNVTEETEIKNFETPMKRKRGADGEIVQAFLSSLDKGSTRLRPRKEVPEFKMVELADEDSERIIGKRVKVYWSGSRKWFAGRVKAFDNKKMLHTIYYEDGDKEDLNLRRERFQLEVMPGENFIQKLDPRSEKKVKGSDDGMVIAELLKNNSDKESKSALKKDLELRKKEAPKNALRRGSSKPKKKDVEARKAEDLVNMDVDMIPEDVDESETDEVKGVEGSEKDHLESKSLLDKATDAKDPSEAQASRLEFNSETMDMGSDRGEEGKKSVKGSAVKESDAQPKHVKVNKRAAPKTSHHSAKDKMEDLAAGVEVVHPIKVDEKVEGGEIEVEGPMVATSVENNDGEVSFSQAVSEGTCKKSLNLQPSEPESLEEDPEILEGKLKITNRESVKAITKEAQEENLPEGTAQTSARGPKQPADIQNENSTTLPALAIQKNFVRRARTKVEIQ